MKLKLVYDGFDWCYKGNPFICQKWMRKNFRIKLKEENQGQKSLLTVKNRHFPEAKKIQLLEDEDGGIIFKLNPDKTNSTWGHDMYSELFYMLVRYMKGQKKKTVYVTVTLAVN